MFLIDLLLFTFFFTSTNSSISSDLNKWVKVDGSDLCIRPYGYRRPLLCFPALPRTEVFELHPSPTTVTPSYIAGTTSSIFNMSTTTTTTTTVLPSSTMNPSSTTSTTTSSFRNLPTDHTGYMTWTSMVYICKFL